MAARLDTDPLVVSALDLLDCQEQGFEGPRADAFIDEIDRRHSAGDVFRRATAEAIRDCGLEDPDDIAAEVYRNFLWTHFVAKFLMTAAPVLALRYFHSTFQIAALESAVQAHGPAILSSFHNTGYPLVALGLATSPIAPLISKARVDFLDQSPERISDHVVYLSDRSAAVRLTRALKQGTSVWIMLDVVLPSVRVVRAKFLGGSLDVSAGIGAIARLSGRPCLPVFWSPGDRGHVLSSGGPIYHQEGADDDVVGRLVASQAAFIADHPAHWLEWYSILARAPEVRAEVRRGNEAIWTLLSSHAHLWKRP